MLMLMLSSCKKCTSSHALSSHAPRLMLKCASSEPMRLHFDCYEAHLPYASMIQPLRSTGHARPVRTFHGIERLRGGGVVQPFFQTVGARAGGEGEARGWASHRHAFRSLVGSLRSLLPVSPTLHRLTTSQVSVFTFTDAGGLTQLRWTVSILGWGGLD